MHDGRIYREMFAIWRAGWDDERTDESVLRKSIPDFEKMEESLVASSKDYKDFVLEQLSLVPNVSCRPMMGEFLLYSDGVLFGGIYDDRLLVKTVLENEKYKMPEAIPYPGAKPMFLVENVDDKEKLSEIIESTLKGVS